MARKRVEQVDQIPRTTLRVADVFWRDVLLFSIAERIKLVTVGRQVVAKCREVNDVKSRVGGCSTLPKESGA